MELKGVNIHEKLLKERAKKQKEESIDSWIRAVLKELDEKRAVILKKLSTSESEEVNNFTFDKLKSDKIFHINHIKKICVDYRLRFLDTKYFKGDFPAEAITKIRQLEKEHNTHLDGFKIIAPSKLFVLKKADDPLLFSPMGNDYYYLIHKWGKDLHPLRKFKVWPSKNVGNLVFTLFFTCIVLTLLSASFIFNGKPTEAYTLMLFLFYFKFAVGFLLFYGIASGKNFNEFIWQSRYNKVQ